MLAAHATRPLRRMPVQPVEVSSSGSHCLRHVLGDDAGRFSSQTGVLHLLDVRECVQAAHSAQHLVHHLGVTRGTNPLPCQSRQPLKAAWVVTRQLGTRFHHTGMEHPPEHPILHTRTPFDRIQPSYAVFHPADTRHRTSGAHSKREILFKSWERVTSPKEL